MKTKSIRIIAALFALLLAGAAPASNVAIHDLMPPVFDALAQHRASDRVEAFKERVLYPNAPLYDDGYALLDDPHIAWYLASLSPALPALHATDAMLRGALPSITAAFEEAFPRFDARSVAIYLMPSMGNFDGMTRDVAGIHGLLLGVDNIAQEQGAAGILVDHELFHVYHHAINPVFFPTKTENDLYRYGIYRQVWAEGLATYVSQQLNHTTASAALFSRELGELPPDKTKALACFVEEHFDSHSGADATLLFDGGRHPDGLPSRGGYYIGYLAAKDFASTMTLEQLADLKEDALTDALRANVHDRCAGNATSSQPRR